MTKNTFFSEKSITSINNIRLLKKYPKKCYIDLRAAPVSIFVKFTPNIMHFFSYSQIAFIQKLKRIISFIHPKIENTMSKVSKEFAYCKEILKVLLICVKCRFLQNIKLFYWLWLKHEQIAKNIAKWCQWIANEISFGV